MQHFKSYQLKEAFTDPLTWAIVFYALVADIPNGGITNFFSQLIAGFGYTPEQALLYGTPGGAVEVVTLLVGGYLGDRYGNRIIVSSFGLVCGIVGVALIVGLPLSNNSGRLGGYYLTQATAMPFVALLSLISTNVVRTAVSGPLIFKATDYLVIRPATPKRPQSQPCTSSATASATSSDPKSSAPRTPLATSPPKSPSSFVGCASTKSMVPLSTQLTDSHRSSVSAIWRSCTSTAATRTV